MLSGSRPQGADVKQGPPALVYAAPSSASLMPAGSPDVGPVLPIARQSKGIGKCISIEYCLDHLRRLLPCLIHADYKSRLGTDCLFWTQTKLVPVAWFGHSVVDVV